MSIFIGTQNADTIAPGLLSDGVRRFGPHATSGAAADLIDARAGDDVGAGARAATTSPSSARATTALAPGAASTLEVAGERIDGARARGPDVDRGEPPADEPPAFADACCSDRNPARGDTPHAAKIGAGSQSAPEKIVHAIIAEPGSPPIAAVGTSLVVREWTMSGPTWMHVHQTDDEAWHVLEGRLRFKLPDREVDVTAGTTVFVPAGLAHTYWAVEPSRYLIILTPKIDRLIAELLTRAGTSDLRSMLQQYDTDLFEEHPEKTSAASPGHAG